MFFLLFFFFKQKTAYEMRISDCSSDVCSSDLVILRTSYSIWQTVEPELLQARQKLFKVLATKMPLDKLRGRLRALAGDERQHKARHQSIVKFGKDRKSVV